MSFVIIDKRSDRKLTHNRTSYHAGDNHEKELNQLYHTQAFASVRPKHCEGPTLKFLSFLLLYSFLSFPQLPFPPLHEIQQLQCLSPGDNTKRRHEDGTDDETVSVSVVQQSVTVTQ